MVPSKFEVMPNCAQIPLIPLPPLLDSQINNKRRYLAIHPTPIIFYFSYIVSFITLTYFYT